MSNRCARCGELNPRRTQKAESDWVSYLTRERGASEPVGTMMIPLCTDCYADLRDLDESDDAAVHAFLDDLDTDGLVDEVAG